jgi:hypothetical protein
MKKQILLTALTLTLLASAMMTAAAEEVVGEIVFSPYLTSTDTTLAAEFPLDTTGNSVIDTYMRVHMVNKSDSTNLNIYRYLITYLERANKVLFENEGLSSNRFTRERLLAYENDRGRWVELSELFTIDVIKVEFPYLYAKLVREGRAR